MIGGLKMINIDDLRKADYLDFSLERDFNDKNKYNLYCYNNITEEKIIIFKGCKIDDIENFSDGYHTFNELYEFRKLYNALLFKEWKKMESMKFTNQNATITENYVLVGIGSLWWQFYLRVKLVIITK